MKKLILLLIVLAAITEGCKKYPEGPWISFRSAEKRLYGNYILANFTVNGADELNQYYDSLSKNFNIYYENVSSYVNICDMSGTRKDGGMSTLVWSWKLIENNKILKVTSSGTNFYGWSYGPFRNDINPEWAIIKLTNKEIKMKTNYNNKEYIIELKS